MIHQMPYEVDHIEINGALNLKQGLHYMHNPDNPDMHNPDNPDMHNPDNPDMHNPDKLYLLPRYGQCRTRISSKSY
ncbi:hypothetical protein BgiMline_015679 [Biomphalaria glabrata]|nr:hypothetical protein BgiMline_008493 [Biomphalaria glabrata]